MNFSVEEENLICVYHTSDRRRTMAQMVAALPDMDTEMRRLANGTIAKLENSGFDFVKTAVWLFLYCIKILLPTQRFFY